MVKWSLAQLLRRRSSGHLEAEPSTRLHTPLTSSFKWAFLAHRDDAVPPNGPQRHRATRYLPMSAIVSVECTECGYVSRTEYRLLGCVMACSRCHREFLPRVPEGSVLPDTGWELTFGDFIQLVQSDSSRATIGPLLKQWFGYRIAGKGKASRVADTKKALVDLLSLHLEIQRDEPRQHDLYQAAMSLWR